MVNRPMDEARRAISLVRQPPSAATLAWLVEELGASTVLEVRVLQGGLTAAMHRVTVVDRDGHERQVVLRRYVHAEILMSRLMLPPWRLGRCNSSSVWLCRRQCCSPSTRAVIAPTHRRW